MDKDLFQFALTAFVTLLVVVDPLGGAPLFTALLRDQPPQERGLTLRRAVGIAFGVSLFFLFAGRAVLFHLGVTVHALGISGGILLFATALPMLFGQRPGLQAPKIDERATSGEDMAVFPMAIPLLSGPGTIASIILLNTQAGSDTRRLGLLVAVTSLVFGITWIVLHTGEKLMAWLGEGKMHILTRVLGIVLAALAVQYVLNGISDFHHALAGK